MCCVFSDVVRYQCLIENVPDKIITCMTKFANEVMIQEAGLEAFAVLAGAGKCLLVILFKSTRIEYYSVLSDSIFTLSVITYNLMLHVLSIL